MNHAVTIGVKKTRGKVSFAILSDPNVPMKEQRRNFKKLRIDLHGEYDEVQLWTSSGGRVKRQRTYGVVAAPVPVAVPVESSSEGADLLSLGSEPTQAAAETTVPVNSGEVPVTSPAPSKKADSLAKARAAAAAKKASKAK